MHTYQNELTELAIDIGEALLVNGGEIRRVEDTIDRICKSGGAYHTEAFCIIKSIIVTTKFKDGTTYTSSRRIKSTSYNYKRINMLNSLSRSICAGEIDINEARQKLKEIKKGFKCPLYKTLLGNALLASSLCIFFGGTFFDALMTIPPALFVCAYTAATKKLGMTKAVYSFIASFLSGTIIMLMYICGIDIHPGHVITGSFMILIPGVAFSNSIEDLFLGDTTSGLLNICETLLSACAIAVGYALAVVAFGVSDIYNAPTPHSWIILLIASAVSSFAYATMGNASMSLFVFTSLGGLVCYATYLPIYETTQNEFLSMFLAASASTLYSRICARALKCPTPIFSTPAVIPLVPGNSLYLSIHYALKNDWDKMQTYLLKTLIIASGIALGLMSVMFMWDLIQNLINTAKVQRQNQNQ